MATITPFSLDFSFLTDMLSMMDKPLYEKNIRPGLMAEIEPTKDVPSTVTKKIEYGDETISVEVRPATQHWALYYMDGMTMCTGPGGIKAHERFLETHIPICRNVEVRDMGVNLGQKLVLAVREATLEYHSNSKGATPHYIH